MLYIDLLRFVASAGIVFHHSHEFFVDRSAREALTQRTMGLALFVDLFFVISGFVIAYVYQSRVGSLAEYGRFLQRRVGRLVPLHWLTLVVAGLLWGIALAAGVEANHAPSMKLSCVLDTVFLLHGFVPCGNGIYLNSVTWSISAEMVMYIFFPLFAAMVRRNASTLLIIGISALAFDIIWLGVNHIDYPSDIPWVSLPPLARALPSFVIGITLFQFRGAFSLIPYARSLFWLLLAAVMYGMLTGAPQLVVLSGIYLLAVVAIGSDAQGGPDRVTTRIAPFGQLTYSLYMWHGLLIFVVLNVLGDKILKLRPSSEFFLGMITYGLIFVMGYVSFFYFEQPARRAIDGWGRTGSRLRRS